MLDHRSMNNTITPQRKTIDFILEPADNQRLSVLCGQFDENLRQIERRFDVAINNRGGNFRVVGEKASAKAASETIQRLYQQIQTGGSSLSSADIRFFLEQADNPQQSDSPQTAIYTKRGSVKPRTLNQKRFIEAIQANDICFGIGPAGTGKTYLAVACAIYALDRQEVSRIILTRPAVEAGERLGFLPGDLSQKIDPYLRPLYDALYELMGPERVVKLIERNVIEIAPLAYMRGRTLSNAFVILDESQNTTVEQMKMLVTRLGQNSKMVINGDITQIDLPRDKESGLRQVMRILNGVPGIEFIMFEASDVVRHPLVQHIVLAYERFEQERRAQKTGP